MKFFRSLSIVTKIVLFSTVLAAIFLGTSYVYMVAKTQEELTRLTLKNLEIEVASKVSELEIITEEMHDNVLAISNTPPFQGIIRAEKNNGFDRADNSTISQWKDRLSDIFMAQLESIDFIDQYRYIDENGKEIIRVDLNNGNKVRIPEEELQNKKNRTYFLEASLLNEGEIYVSPVELNREGDPPLVTIPFKPVIRYATPIFDEDTKDKRGILIINFLMDSVLNKISFTAVPSGELYITDTEGYYFVNPNKDREWSGVNNLGTGFNLFSDFSEISKTDFSNDHGSFEKNNSIFVYSWVNPNSAEATTKFLVLEKASRDDVLGDISKIIDTSILIGISSFLLLFFLFLFFINYLMKPLKTLAQNAYSVGQGDFSHNIEVKTNDEIGKLSKVFNEMTGKLKEMYSSMDEKINESTKDLREAKADSEKKLEETERLNKIMINRELKMAELKKELKALKEKHGRS